MRIQLNGEPYALEGEPALLALLDTLGAKSERVAVLINGQVVPRSQRETCRLEPGDAVEVLTFAGGG